MELGKIQDLVLRAVQDTRLLGKVDDRTVQREHYVHYLVDVYHYACHSSQVISLAGSRLVRTHAVLADYLFTHAREELGHEHWAAADLRDLGYSDEDITRSHPSEACTRMLGIEYLYAAHLNPVGLFGWMFVLESLGGRIGGSIADALDSALSLQGKALYFLRGHGEADAHHSEDLERVIATNVSAAQDRHDFEHMTNLSRAAYVEILDCAANVVCSKQNAS